VCQEIFGVNVHIRSVCDKYAKEGYVAIAPAFFDLAEKGAELGYEPPDVERGKVLQAKVSMDAAVKYVDAAKKIASEAGRVGVLGYCWGGTIAWASACRLDGLSAAVAYYGGGIAKMLQEQPKTPVLAHFGEKDYVISMDDIAAIRSAHPEAVVYTYDAGHGFNCDMRGSYHQPSADLAFTRTLEFLRKNIG
jgi:carboxymethylenebutenolidase